ncbi:hypothetical protein D0Z08_27500 [Nocardioides immobilis]|uniref:DUF3108 domain-containing protein n=1 Tax=Nocardioides immobilis TaxID=2049295 RepID=A0A417XU48_9ACTN|nr:hypothetical protein [Nocardioides immobilis]RHW23840.1 hypothetical protein D0Z08_27500 [Nocardioides immobilis]
MADGTGDPHVLAPGTAPTPFTAAQIRDGARAGKEIRVRVEAAGETPYFRVNRYLECDEAGAVLERFHLALDGSPIGDPELDPVAWLDLQGHASFPVDATTIEPERIETPLGELDCLRYTVREGATENVFWFATDLPGMPVRFVTRIDGEVALTVSMVANVNP